jgi:DnaJ-class molecular chaperone
MSKPHEVLGIAPNASRDEIRTAFRRLAAKHHPDRAGGNNARFAEISVAQTAMLDRLSEMGTFDDIFTQFSKEFRSAHS